MRESDRALGGFVPLTGTIKGSAIHLPELAGSVPAYDARISFGSDGRTALSAVAFGVTPTTPVAAVSGMGSGNVVLSNAAGHTCNGTSFSWALAQS